MNPILFFCESFVPSNNFIRQRLDQKNLNHNEIVNDRRTIAQKFEYDTAI